MSSTAKPVTPARAVRITVAVQHQDRAREEGSKGFMEAGPEHAQPVTITDFACSFLPVVAARLLRMSRTLPLPRLSPAHAASGSAR